MLIVLLRHGIAEDRRPDLADDDRRLTRKGHRRMKKVARALTRLVPRADAIYSSPLVRAYETAEHVAHSYRGRVAIETTSALRPGSDPAEIRALLARATGERLYLVGHEPHLTNLMRALTGITGGELELRKGGCYVLELDDAQATARLKWMLAPRVLRRLRR